MSPQHFDTVLSADEETAFFIQVPAQVVAALGKQKRPPVRVTLNGFAYRTTVSVYGGKYYLPVRREIRQGAHLEPGDAVAVNIELDDEPRTVDVPEDLANALASNPEALVAFDRLPYSHPREYVDWIAEAKREETRRKRIERAVVMLREGRGEP